MNEYASGVTQAFTNGSIDQVRIFNRVITANEVTTLYGETSASSTKSTTDIFADSSALALYEFEGNANDTGGTYNGTATNVVYNEYDGTASNVTYSTGKFGQAAVFNGSSSYITLTQPVNLSTDNFTYSFWIYPTTNTGYGAPLAQYGNSTPTRNFYSYRVGSTEKITFGLVSTGAVFNQLISTGTTPLNQWSHVALVRDSSTQKIYINGQLSGTLSNTTTTSTSSEPFLIGDTNDVVADEFFEGKIDQVRIYDKALSAADVTTLYNETVTTASTNITLEVPSLVAYYKMNDATDETGSYDGTPTNVNFNVAGKFGNAGEFNGSSSVIVVPNNMLNTSGHSVSMWFNLDNTNGIQTVVEFDYENRILFRAVSTDSNLAYVGNSGYFNHGIAFSAGQWYHLVITFSAGNPFKIYVDGVLSYTGGNTNILAQSNDNILGSSNSSGSNGVDGKIDQVRIFDREITSDEVTTLYNEVYCQPTIVPTEHFEPVLYTGNGSSQSISTLDFQPDLVWIKARVTAYDHRLFDSVRTLNGRLESNTTAAEVSNTVNDNFVSFNSNGFTLGATSSTNGSNFNNEPFVAWNWKAGGAAVSNTDGTITSQVSANTDAGFSIVKWTAESTVGTVGHGLSTTPELIIFKRLDTSQDWYVETDSIDGSYDYLVLNSTAAKVDGSGAWSTRADSTTITSFTGTANADYIAYCLHSVDGMSRIGSYVGTGTSGNAIVTGFRPAFVMVKNTSSGTSSSWWMIDAVRNPSNPRNNRLVADQNFSETSYSPANLDFNSNGFTLDGSYHGTNANGNTYIFMAFAEENVEPQPELANSFNTVTYTGNGGTQAVTGVGFQPDLVWIKNRGTTQWHGLYDSVRGASKWITSNATNAEADTAGTTLTSFNIDGFSLGDDTNGYGANTNNNNYVAWCWKASNESTINQEGSVTSIVSANPAAGFSVVRHTGTGSAATVGHGLSSTPELIIRKDRDAATDWWVYASVSPYFGYLNHTDAFQSANNAAYSYNQTVPTSTIFNVGNTYSGNVNNNDYIAYCFHSVDGYQKVGSYTGVTGDITVTTGFRPRFVMLKRTNSTGHWEIHDSTRFPTVNNENGASSRLRANDNSAEGSFTNSPIFFTDTGFVLDSSVTANSYGDYDANGSTYIYLAIA